MGDSSLCHGLTHIAMPQAIYLKPEPQLAKHLVSLDAYNIFIAATITEAFSEFIKFKTLLAVNHINITKTHLLHAIIIILKFARSHHLCQMKCLDTPYSTSVSLYHLALP